MFISCKNHILYYIKSIIKYKSINMSERFKTFGDISELTPREQDELSVFHGLNKIVEENKTISWYQDIVKAYSQAILNMWEEWVDFSEYWELDFQVKYLLEEMNQTNGILSFADKKFKLIETVIAELLENIWPLSKEKSLKIFNIMNDYKEWKLCFKICDIENNDLNEVLIPFNLNIDFRSQYIEMRKRFNKLKELGISEGWWKCMIKLSVEK